MQITKIEINNYRLLKTFSIDLDKELSLVVGKNNSGKTSLLLILKNFLSAPKDSHPFSFDDFNLDFSDELKKLIQEDLPEPESYTPKGITLELFIDYSKEDNLANISKLMMDLDPNNNRLLLSFEYILSLSSLGKLKEDFSNLVKLKKDVSKDNPIDFRSFLKTNYKTYFKLCKKTVDLKNRENFINLDKESDLLKKIINYKFIQANREVSNKDSEKSLSTLASEIYEKIESDEKQSDNIGKLKDQLQETDKTLNTVYSKIFSSVIQKVKKFGGLKPDSTIISITSTLQHKDILKGNTTVLYNHGDHELPENHNGLGYMNLINMIFEIEIKVNEFKREKELGPADINLLFIEEPEAHTHPQMQYIFIKNIKELLKGVVGESHQLQYIISTHSSHIVSESDFEDIKYLKRETNTNNVEAKNLKQLKEKYGDDDKHYKFLKQYLTLHRAELFFADKVIFIEGDTERILLPAIMKKIDQDGPSGTPLLSQNISIVETGNYSHIFEKFIDFIGVKSLIITDIDSATKDNTKCKADDKDAVITTNPSLKFFYDSKNLSDFKDEKIEKIENMVLKKKGKKWVKDCKGSLVCVYQSNEENSAGKKYFARAFEDSFFHLNRSFIKDNKDGFKSLKNIDNFDNTNNDPYELAEQCIQKKPAFVIEILLNSEADGNGNEFSNWEIPDYIKKGLLWLKTD